ncbi:MAG: hypothetical protein SGILL_010114 [Bacillariaceae sp.]
MTNATTLPIQTSDESPPTLLYGRHAQSMATILKKHGVQTQIVESFQEIVVHAGLKLLWASCLWLLCHSTEVMKDDGVGDAVTIGQVLEQRHDALDRLVDELLPVLCELVDGIGEGSSKSSSAMLLTRQHVDEYLRNYSKSIAGAIPSKALALKEVQERNGVFFRSSQTFHRQLLEEHLSEKDLENLENGRLGLQSNRTEERIGVDLGEVELKVWGIRSDSVLDERSHDDEQKRVVIVGGGIMGSSVALSLARRRPNWDITIIDQNPEHDMGKTTNASFAWVNGNSKFPKSYQNFNQLGVHAWKRHPQLQNVISWMGSLMRFGDFPQWVDDGGYPLEGPLTRKRIEELEPLACFASGERDKNLQENVGYTFFFPDEGCVEPLAAVKMLRQAAKDLGVRVVCGQNVTNVVYCEETGSALYVESVPCESEPELSCETIAAPADLVIAAAGCGLSASFFGGIPLLERPGCIEYGRLNLPPVGTFSLRRILVDAERSSHVLQRRNGDVVAGGGGKLEFGGVENSGATEMIRRDDKAEDMSQLRKARRLVPSLLQRTVSVKSCSAVRPMPLDGLPVVGFQHPGLYNIVTHSGVTLAPFLGALAAAEITESVSFEVLDPFRPFRFRK